MSSKKAKQINNSPARSPRREKAFADAFVSAAAALRPGPGFDAQLREIRKEIFYRNGLAAFEPQTKVTEQFFEDPEVKAFVENGIPTSTSERIGYAREMFFQFVLLTAATPCDLRGEVDVMLRALEDVQKSLPKRKSGPKVDALIDELLERIDSGVISRRDAYREYRRRQGFLAETEIDKEEYDYFSKKLRNRRSAKRRSERRSRKNDVVVKGK